VGLGEKTSLEYWKQQERVSQPISNVTIPQLTFTSKAKKKQPSRKRTKENPKTTPLLFIYPYSSHHRRHRFAQPTIVPGSSSPASSLGTTHQGQRARISGYTRRTRKNRRAPWARCARRIPKLLALLGVRLRQEEIENSVGGWRAVCWQEGEVLQGMCY
jgi:hypothetical protein